jgi:uncharacterized protein YdeI (YjbR/CyaY-like superfamily)
MNNITDYPIKSFISAKKWNAWLADNHAASKGVWLRIFKKDSGDKTMTHSEVLDEALCFGWIDGQGKPYDDKSWLLKFTPRRPKSIWSKRNTEHVERLIKEKRMKSAGIKEVENAKKDGRWERAYDSSKNMEMPSDFLEALKKDKEAYAFFKTLNRANTYAIAWRLQTAGKPETREKRMEAIIATLSDGKRLH